MWVTAMIKLAATCTIFTTNQNFDLFRWLTAFRAKMVKIISFGPEEGGRKPFHDIRNLYQLQMMVHPEDDIKKRKISCVIKCCSNLRHTLLLP
jgi:hypothetical protein